MATIIWCKVGYHRKTGQYNNEGAQLEVEATIDVGEDPEAAIDDLTEGLRRRVLKTLALPYERRLDLRCESQVFPVVNPLQDPAAYDIAKTIRDRAAARLEEPVSSGYTIPGELETETVPASEPATETVPPPSETNGDGNGEVGPLACVDCKGSMKRSQVTLSLRHFGNKYCPDCQRNHVALRPSPAKSTRGPDPVEELPPPGEMETQSPNGSAPAGNGLPMPQKFLCPFCDDTGRHLDDDTICACDTGIALASTLDADGTPIAPFPIGETPEQEETPDPDETEDSAPLEQPETSDKKPSRSSKRSAGAAS